MREHEARGAVIDHTAQPRVPPLALAAAGLLAATLAAVFVSQGNPVVSVAPLLLVGFGWMVWTAPLRVTAAATLFVALFLDADMRGVREIWSSPLEPLRVFFFENLHKVIPIQALKMSALDLLALLLTGLVIYRRAVLHPRDGHGVRSVSWLRLVLALALLGMVGGATWGMLRHGLFQQAYWQLRQPLYLPILTFLFLASFRDMRDVRLVGAATVVAAVLKSIICIYFYEFIARRYNMRPSYVTSHGDSVLFVLALMITLIAWHEKVSAKTRWWLAASVPFVLLGLYINNRRLAWVELTFAFLAFYALTPWTFVKRTLARTLIFATPALVVYLAAGWESTSSVFRPAQMVRSVVDSNVDRSSLDRDVENYNLVVTLRANPLLGSGFGHEYQEIYKADDISNIFPQYRFIPHNSVLGLLAFGGVIFFTLMWLPITAGMYLAIRTYRMAPTPLTRTAALSVVTALIAYTIQAWGDMGIQGWGTCFIAAASLAVVGQLAPAVGAWPSGRREPARAAAAARRVALAPASFVATRAANEVRP